MRSYTETFEQWCAAQDLRDLEPMRSERRAYYLGAAHAMAWCLEHAAGPPLLDSLALAEQLSLTSA